MKKLNIVLASIFLAALASCAPVAPVDSSSVPDKDKIQQVYPESDNKNSWSLNSVVEIDTTSYRLTVRIIDEQKANQTTQSSISGSAYGSYAYVSGRSWQEGKGILPVEVISVSPETTWAHVGDKIILKTTDLKVMGVPLDATIDILCNHDVEVLSPVASGQTLTTDRLTDEFDACRMVSPQYK